MAGRSDANTPHSGEPDDELGELDNILADLQDESEVKLLFQNKLG